MPLCVSCRGEYWVPSEEPQEPEPQATQTADLPWSGQSQETEPQTPPDTTPPAPGSGLEIVYGLEHLPPFECARCHQSNQRWHQWATAGGRAHFNRFFFRSVPWGLLAVLSIFLPFAVVVAAELIDPVASIPIGLSLALLLIFVNVALLYALKDALWRYDLLSRVARRFLPPLWLLAVTAFVLALAFGLAIAFMVEARLDDGGAEQRTEGLVRVINTILLSLTFVNVTLSAMFMAAHDYGNWLNRTMPQPIYAQERRLLGVIQEGLQARIRQAMGGKGEAVETTIVDIERTKNAGVTLMISAEGDSDERELKQLQNWRVTADLWGRVQKMNREGLPQYIKVMVPDNAEADKSEAKSDDGRSVVKEGEIVQPGEEAYQSRSETTIAVTSRRRNWME